MLVKTFQKISWFLFAFFAIGVGIYPFAYFFVDRKFGLLNTKSAEVLSDSLWNIGFYGHIVLGGIALTIGWIQFSKKLRTSNIKLHRMVGIGYVFSVLISSISGIYIGIHATGGIIAKAGFVCLGIVWFYTTLQGFLAVKKGNIAAHEKMMIYSYAVCFAAVTLRIYLPILSGIFGNFFIAYRIIAWLCWVPNLLVAFWIVKRKEKYSTLGL